MSFFRPASQPPLFHRTVHPAAGAKESSDQTHRRFDDGEPVLRPHADAADRDDAGEPIHPNNNGVDAGPLGADPDPDHDFEPVMLQMYGRDAYDPKATPTMNHFIESYANTCREAKVGNPDQRALTS